jgi:branched-chain amino acid transport system ATP-binding protein
MLEIRNLNTHYGRVQALWDVTLNVNEAEIVGLIGANGAGKTTLLNTVSGIVSPTSGSITFLGRKINGVEPHEIVAMGLSQIPEGGCPFADMTVHENLEMGAYPYQAWKQKEKTLKEVFQVFPALKEREKQLARTLSGGEKQMLAIGRGLMSRPKLCMFDEPSYGLAPKVVLEVFKVIKTLREQGITILLIEQNVRYTLETAGRAYVLENGRVVMEGTCQTLLESDYVRQAYLGISLLSKLV